MAVLAVLGACLAGGMLPIAGSSAHAATAPEVKCATAKHKAAGAKLAARFQCEAAAVVKGQPVDSGCVSSIEDKLGQAFTKAESRGGCANVGDVTLVSDMMNNITAAFLNTVATRLRCDGGDCNGCASCAAGDECSDEVYAVYSDPVAYALAGCLDNCPAGDLACDDACMAARPDAVPVIEALYACLYGQCPVSCQAGPDPARCGIAKRKAAAQSVAAELKCHATALTKNTAVDQACLDNAQQKLQKTFQKTEDKNVCVVSGDVGTVEGMVDSTVTQILTRVPTTPTTTLPPDPCLAGGCDSCFLCVQDDGGACQNDLSTCNGNPECAAIVDCINPCPDEACVDVCVAEHPDGLYSFLELVECLFDNCDSVCQ